MEVVVTTGAIRRAKLQSKCHHQVRCPSCRPTNSVKALKGKACWSILQLLKFVLATDEGSSDVRQRTFAQLYSDVAQLAAAMKSVGIHPGDRVVGEFAV